MANSTFEAGEVTAGDLVEAKYLRYKQMVPDIGIVLSRDERAVKILIGKKIVTSIVDNWKIINED